MISEFTKKGSALAVVTALCASPAALEAATVNLVSGFNDGDRPGNSLIFTADTGDKITLETNDPNGFAIIDGTLTTVSSGANVSFFLGESPFGTVESFENLIFAGKALFGNSVDVSFANNENNTLTATFGNSTSSFDLSSLGASTFVSYTQPGFPFFGAQTLDFDIVEPDVDTNVVPLPAAAWMLISGLGTLALAGGAIGRREDKNTVESEMPEAAMRREM